ASGTSSERNPPGDAAGIVRVLEEANPGDARDAVAPGLQPVEVLFPDAADGEDLRTMLAPRRELLEHRRSEQGSEGGVRRRREYRTDQHEVGSVLDRPPRLV